MKRREAREKAFQFLFQIDFNEETLEHSQDEYFDEQVNDKFLTTLIEGVIEKQTDLDAKISEYLENWSLNRLPNVERTLLRIATFEILFLDDIPVNVSINEAVELGNVFGDEKSGKFINGVLSKLINEGGK
ncbi:transcription antitermination factor NusB [Oceanobacillus sp. CAU 1775]